MPEVSSGRWVVDILHESNVLSVITELTGRGLSIEQIELALQKMVGRDWKEISVMLWHRRLQEQSFIVHDERERFLDDLEALVKGRTALDELYKKNHQWGLA